MKYCLVLCMILVSTAAFPQRDDVEKEKDAILLEGTKLYEREMASWYGTDVFLEKFPEKRPEIGGYFSYVDGEKPTCIFFSRDQPPKILASLTFDSTYDVNTASVDGIGREMTRMELDLLAIRTSTINEYKTDRGLFKSYEKMNPNFIPVIDDLGKRVYVLTGPTENGVVVFGNDYLLTFNEDNSLKEKKSLHANLIPIRDDKSTVVLSTMHSHLPATGSLITATDICTLKLYCRFTKWKQHYVISKDYVSIWDCDKGPVILSREAWEKIGKNK